MSGPTASGPRPPILVRTIGALAIVAFACIALLGAVCAVELAGIIGGDIDGYPWGWEGGGWRYASPGNYSTSLTIQLALCAIAIGSVIVRPRRRVVLWVIVACVALQNYLGY